jgi:hypothetical protein
MRRIPTATTIFLFFKNSMNLLLRNQVVIVANA